MSYSCLLRLTLLRASAHVDLLDQFAVDIGWTMPLGEAWKSIGRLVHLILAGLETTLQCPTSSRDSSPCIRLAPSQLNVTNFFLAIGVNNS